MDLSSDLVSQFVKVTNDRNTQKKETIVYGTITSDGERLYVQLDGSELSTPIETTVEVKSGDRVRVSIKNHIATVIGNIDDPSASGWRLDEVGDTVTTNHKVIIESLANGTTVIDGACIKTGKVEAERLNLTGAITFGDLNSETQTRITDVETAASDAAADAATANEAAANAASAAATADSRAQTSYAEAQAAMAAAQAARQVADDANDIVWDWSYTYKGTTYIDGSRIMAGTVTASTLEGGEIILLDSSGDDAGSIRLNQASSYSGPAVSIDTGAVAILAYGGAVYLEGSGGAAVDLDDIASFQCDIGANGSAYSCGTSSATWTDIYCENAEIQTSDLKVKTEVNYDMGRFDAVFDSLRPCTFKFKERNRTHMGMIAQDVEQILLDHDIPTNEFAAFIKSPRKDEKDVYDYALRYGEFIPMLIDQIHRLKSRVEILEKRLNLEETEGV